MMRRSYSRRRRAATLLEFVLTLPLSLGFCMFIIDAGRVYIAASAVQDAAWRSARAAAVAGDANARAVGGQLLNGQVMTVAEDAFYQALAENQAGDAISHAKITVTQGSCSSGRVSGSGISTDVIEVKGTAGVATITPGLNLLLGGNEATGDWSISAVGVARCEKSR